MTGLDLAAIMLVVALIAFGRHAMRRAERERELRRPPSAMRVACELRDVYGDCAARRVRARRFAEYVGTPEVIA